MHEQNDRHGNGGILEKILLVVDGTEAANAAGKFAVALAARTGACLMAVYPVDTATMDFLLRMHILVHDERSEFEAAIEAKGRGYLDYTKRLAEAAGVPVETCFARGRFHEEIARLAYREKAGVVVIGNWRGARRSKDSSAVERELLLENLRCPLTVVKSG